MLVERGGGAAAAGDDEDVFGAVLLRVLVPPVGDASRHLCGIGRDLEFSCLKLVAEVVSRVVMADGVECAALLRVALAERRAQLARHRGAR